jgi:hypothetical protein
MSAPKKVYVGVCSVEQFFFEVKYFLIETAGVIVLAIFLYQYIKEKLRPPGRPPRAKKRVSMKNQKLRVRSTSNGYAQTNGK